MHEDVRDHIDELFQELTISGAGPTLETLARDLPDGASGRAEYLTAAGESYLQAERLEDAKRCVQDAIADGGETVLLREAMLINILLTEGDDNGADEISTALRRRARDLSGLDIEQIAEAYELADRPEQAHRWYTLALRPYEPAEIAHDVRASHAAISRRRVRRQLGLPEDRFDAAAKQARAEATGADPDDLESDELPPMALLYWPKAEFKRYIALFPQLAEGYDWNHAGHRAQVQDTLTRLADAGSDVTVASATVAGFLAYADERGLAPASSQARSFYAAELQRTGRAAPWPPGPDDRCWCGSGKKYGRCCGA